MKQDNQNLIYDGPNIAEEDKSYTKHVVGSKQQDGELKILGVRWNFV